MRIAFYTLGCKVNQYETEAMREAFIGEGHEAAADGEPFDAAVINSCTVTAESDRKTRQLLRRVRRENTTAIIVLTGCMAQAFSKESAALEDADIIAGNTDIEKIVRLVEKFALDGEKIIEVAPHTKKERFNTPSINNFAERTRAYMKIQDGCDRYCSYCIIPTARGAVRSKPIEEIATEAENLSRSGFSEIVLVGINLSSYGREFGLNLCDAVEAICGVEGIKRVRLGSLEPDHISDEMLSRFKNQDKFCPQFHLSLQSGCDRTLKRMNRHYDTAFYTDLAVRIRKMFPDASITTDIMVGFAGETEEEFQESLNYLKSIGFAKSHVFAYSRRKGTVAYGLPDQISRVEKTRRSRLMLAAAAECEAQFLKKQIGSTVPVLFETAADSIAKGYTPNYTPVHVLTDNPHTGEILNVKLISAEKDYCTGEII